MPQMAALIMAAGQGSRFGECKQLVSVNGKPLLQHSIDIAQALCPGHVFAVSGAWDQELRLAIKSKKMKEVTLIHNPEWANGIGCSIARGVSFLSNDFDNILILLADQIALRTEDVFGLLSHVTGNNIVCGFYEGKRGVPAIFGRNSFEQLCRLQGDRGAKSLLYHQHVPVVEYPLAHASIDIDTPEDLRQWMVASHKKGMIQVG